MKSMNWIELMIIDETLNMDEIEDMDIYLAIWLNWNVGSVDEKYPTLQMDGMDYNTSWIDPTIWLEMICWMKPDGMDEWKNDDLNEIGWNSWTKIWLTSMKLKNISVDFRG